MALEIAISLLVRESALRLNKEILERNILEDCLVLRSKNTNMMKVDNYLVRRYVYKGFSESNCSNRTRVLCWPRGEFIKNKNIKYYYSTYP